MNGFWYFFGLYPSYLFHLFCLRTRVYFEDHTRQNRKLRGKALILANHKSPLDGLVVMHKYPFRRIYYVQANFFKDKLKFLAPFIRISGGILVDREAYSFDFFEESKQLLHKNRLVLLFPEGRFAFEYEPVRFKYSYIALALQSGAPIVPIASDCNYGFSKQTHILIGNSIDLRRYATPDNLTKEAMVEINELVYQRFIRLYYLLKKRVHQNFRDTFEAGTPIEGDMLRVPTDGGFRYGVYISDAELVQYGDTEVHTLSLRDFCGDQAPQRRVFARRVRRHKRATEDVVKYARFCIGQKTLADEEYTARDFANRIVFM
ncbi:MAG: 1-acyl-sn-glycerol-3-phosphate acyltransferase [Clostridiales bacterium]|nr:1-acyl-sn-glycerol-3-phosphate acyltransferase [Clostridiales bacterium]